MLKIQKKATDKNAYRRNLSAYPKARDAWEAVLSAYFEKNPQSKVILPAYIGWTVTEGSGIFDPVTNVGIPYEFYALDRRLRIDVEHFKSVVKSNPGCIVLLVHYFGFPDDLFREITRWLDANAVFYVEDSAHAMLSDLIGGSCGRSGMYNLYSLHKNLPYHDGGLLVDNNKKSLTINTSEYLDIADVFEYDLLTIYREKRRNYEFLASALKDTRGITVLYPELPEGVCPQTFPVLLDDFNRDEVYQSMNDLGFGLVSLYYTMIDPLKQTEFESASYTSKKITNLPVHQDCNMTDLELLVEAFKKLKA